MRQHLTCCQRHQGASLSAAFSLICVSRPAFEAFQVLFTAETLPAKGMRLGIRLWGSTQSCGFAVVLNKAGPFVCHPHGLPAGHVCLEMNVGMPLGRALQHLVCAALPCRAPGGFRSPRFPSRIIAPVEKMPATSLTVL